MTTTIEPHNSIALFMDGFIPLFQTGNFTFSALFHSYMNPRHLCGECVENGSVCCDIDDQTENCPQNCDFRLVFYVQPYLATALDVELPSGGPEYRSDNISMVAQGSSAFPVTNRSNPYTAELRTWTVSRDWYHNIIS